MLAAQPSAVVYFYRLGQKNLRPLDKSQCAVCVNWCQITLSMST